jgi:hypothetical protein
MNKSHLKFFFLMTAASIGCDGEANSRESSQVNQQQSNYTRNQPAPTFDWSLERSLMIQLYVARNQRLSTFTYVLNHMTGAVIMSCPSLGFPIPATTQLTNPQTTATGYQSITTLAQAEPNGLYAPPSTHGTWVMCLEPNGSIEPRYVENDVITTVRPMEERNGKLEAVEGVRPNLVLNATRR